MARKLTENEREYLRDEMRGYLNGHNDIGPEEYPKISAERLAGYAYDSIAFDAKHGEIAPKRIYFCGKEGILAACREIIESDWELAELCAGL